MHDESIRPKNRPYRARPGRKQREGGGACHLGLEAVTVTVVGTWKARKRERLFYSFSVLSDAISSPLGRSGDQGPCLWWLNIALRMQHAAWAAGL